MEKKLTLALPKRVDTNNAEQVARELNAAIAEGDAGKGIVLDADALEYISSAGLRVLLALKKSHADLTVVNVSRDVYDIFETTGFDQILGVQKKKRVVSVEGCEVIGEGGCGTVYRIDPETIIKVYRDATEETLDEIENEKNMAKLALVSGIPTAISYDIVRVGDSYGAVFELLNAVTFNDMVIKRPEDLETIVRQFISFVKLIHHTEIVDPAVPSAKKKFYRYLDNVRTILGEPLYEKLRGMVEKIRDSHKVVHGDLQMKNVMLVDGEPMLIDMDTLSTGDFIFDLQALYVTYIAYSEDEPENPMNFLGISCETAHEIWEKIFAYYFEDGYPGGKETVLQKIQILAYIRFMSMIAVDKDADTPLSKLRIEHSRQKLDALTKLYDDLNI